MKPKVQPTSVEQVMREDDFIVSKTDTKGVITYCNRIFMEFAKYDEHELIGQQHNIVRHPDMPRCIFKLLWDTIKQKQEINAYVKNLSSDGSYYWVHANVTPVIDDKGEIQGYYSVRRKPNQVRLEKIKQLYKTLLEEERKYGPKEGLQASSALLNNLLKNAGKSYEEFIFTL
ncbi:MAG: PAS domain-containing protein [Ignavibacteriaceae bacterium]|nr:PAS domain-containing protein [Ignavibacteriaceae bacterium]